jgi:dTDP-4-amino-4,6-dideoxygalactose transaminase
MTTWKQFMDEIENETRQEGQESLDELQTMRQYYRKQGEQPCLIEAFFEHQKTLPAARRSNMAMISCPCHRCNPGSL